RTHGAECGRDDADAGGAVPAVRQRGQCPGVAERAEGESDGDRRPGYVSARGKVIEPDAQARGETLVPRLRVGLNRKPGRLTIAAASCTPPQRESPAPRPPRQYPAAT